MKVHELLIALAAADPDAEVIIQKDAEGNDYSPLSCTSFEAVYIPDSTWSGRAYWTDWSASDACMSDAEWDAIKSKPRCVVLHPIN